MQPRSLIPVGGLLSKAPFRAHETIECAVPLFHALGFGQAMLALLLGSTVVVRRRFDPCHTLESLARHRATTMIAVPIMLRRMIDWAPRPGADTTCKRCASFSSPGSQLGAGLCADATKVFGPVLYNMYGSTEVAYATVATPTDLEAEPGCVGRVVPGAVVGLFDDAGRPVQQGHQGRIFVANGIQFTGYTGGGTKESIDGLIATGDIGHLDSAGRLFIDGRADDMIVSGGENVFPAEVEEALPSHPDYYRGRRHRHARLRIRAAAACLRRRAPRRGPHPKATSTTMCGNGWHDLRCLATSCSSTRSPAIRPARSSPACSVRPAKT